MVLMSVNYLQLFKEIWTLKITRYSSPLSMKQLEYASDMTSTSIDVFCWFNEMLWLAKNRA